MNPSATAPIEFFVPGIPQGKGRARAGRGPKGRVRMFTPPETVAYESLIAFVAHQAMAGAAPFSCAVSLRLVITHPVPESWSSSRRTAALSGAVRAKCKPDIDNVVKAIGDGANGVLWKDDSQITELTASRLYGYTPGVRVQVFTLPDVQLCTKREAS